ncbi:MAG TPA: hypothetical protein PLK77_04335 [Pyrinomonadaceae bacterium]|nr:hypothetical protein [Pyrinomonadaceae bacterium]
MKFSEISLKIPVYEGGLADPGQDDDFIDVQIDHGEVVVWANPSGLRTLAIRLLSLAQEDVPEGYHFHLSSSYGLEESSASLILGRQRDSTG